MAKRTLPNRGYIFEAVWAAAIAARFYRRLGDFENITKTKALQKSISRRVELQTLPRISSKDVSDMLIQIWNSGKQLRRQTQNDVHMKSRVKDSLVISIGVPSQVDTLISGMVRSRNFSLINDFIRSSAALANGHANLNYRVKRVAFNGFEDVINITADGLVDQRTVKADVTVTIQTNDGGPNIPPFPVSCKVPGGEQFAQVSGGEWQKFEDLFGTVGVRISPTTHNEWISSMQEYLNEDIFNKKYATRQAIESTNIPQDIKNAAKAVYRSAAASMNSNFPKQSFINYIINGFSNGVDTELVKLTGTTRGGEMYMTGGKTLKVDQEFRQVLNNLNFTAEYKDSDKGAKILINADGIDSPLMQFRYKWENASTGTGANKMYKMYPRHYLEALDGMFDIDPRTQKVSAR
jgi:hypothetical protein